MALQTLRSMASRRHLRPGRRRLRPLQRRRDLDRPALREDALRQRAARARVPARLAGDAATRCCGAPPRRRSTGRCARCARPRAASTARSTPTPRASRASSTCGRSTSCAPRSATTSTPRSPGSARPSAATSRARTSSSRAGPSRRAEERERIRARLLDVRAERVRPGLDDKRLAAWNALMIAALADAGAVLERDDYLDAARAAAAFVLDRMRTPDGRLLRTFNAGEARLDAYLEDHAFLLEALLDALRGDVRGALVRRRARARRHDRRALRRPRARRLLLDLRRPRGAGRAAQGPRGRADPVGRLGGRVRAAAARRADRRGAPTRTTRGSHLRLLHEIAPRHPTAFGHLLQALDFHLAPVREVALAGEPAGVAALAAVVRVRVPPAPRARGRRGRRRRRRCR